MARGAGSGQRWLMALAMAQVAAQAAAPAAQVAAAPAAAAPERDKKQKMEKDTPPPNAPDAALLEYLGRYAEAGDGIDPLSFAAPDDAQRMQAAQGEP
jgi:hypothetical protein